MSSVRTGSGPQPVVRAWDPGGAWREGVDRPPELAAADSWLVDGGRVRGWHLHWARFAAAVAGRADVAAFAAAVVAALPRDGRWFPRVELVSGPAGGWLLQLRLRPAGSPAPAAVAWSQPVPDDRRQPRVKGPDLERLVHHRARAREAGADEALLAAPDGTIREGALSSVVWWDDEVLCAVPDGEPVLEGVTRRLVLGLAHDSGVEVRLARPRAEDLIGSETWLLSARHGIRTVTGWAPGPVAAAPATRAPAWRARLDGLATSLDALAASLTAPSDRPPA